MFQCQRCKRPFKFQSDLSSSVFNNQRICTLCENRERSHPEFKSARETLLAEISKGNLNFEGVGLPPDLEGVSS